jgi:hypothetical protein
MRGGTKQQNYSRVSSGFGRPYHVVEQFLVVEQHMCDE